MAFRAFYALPAENFSTARGQYTNAVHGFTSMLINLIKDQKPTHVAVAFDVSDDTTFRKAEYSEYKGGRNATPAEFAGQIGLIAKVMEAWGIRTIAMPGYEADDVLATLAAQGDAAGFEVLLVSGDRDAFQLINDNVFVLYPKQGVSNIPRMDAAAIEEKYFVKPGLYSDLAALVGESADNLPGVPGVGPKTAAKWINLYGGLEGILENLDAIGGKVGGALKENLENVKRNRRLNQLLTDLDLPITLADLHEPRPDRQAIEELFEELEFRTLRTRLFDLYGDDTAGAAPDTIEAPEFAKLTDAAGLEAFFAAGSGVRSALAVQLVPGRIGDDASALAIVRNNGAAYIELTGLDAPAESVLARWLQDPEEAKVLHEFKSALKALHNRGLGLEGVVDDTSISGYLIQPDRRSYDLAELAQVHLKISLAAAAAQSGQLELDLSGDTDEVAATALVQHAAVVHALSKHFETELAEIKADALLTTLELPVARVLAQMELTGILCPRTGWTSNWLTSPR